MKLYRWLLCRCAHPHEWLHCLFLKPVSDDAQWHCPFTEGEGEESPEKHQATGEFSEKPSDGRIWLIGLAPFLFFWILGFPTVLFALTLSISAGNFALTAILAGMFIYLMPTGLPSPSDMYIVWNPDRIRDRGGFSLNFDIPNRNLYRAHSILSFIFIVEYIIIVDYCLVLSMS